MKLGAATAALLLTVATACGAPTERSRPQVATAAAAPVVAPSPVPAGAAPASGAPDNALEENVRRAIREASADGWQHKKTVDVPGRSAKVVLYDPLPEKAPATKAMRADAVGITGSPYTVRSGIIDVVEHPRTKSLLWDLTGDGPRFVVLHLIRCEPHCGTASPLVLELSSRDEFRRLPDAPDCPTCIQDADRDGVPEFTFRMLDLTIAPCSRASCGPETALLVQVRGLQAWDGERFSKNLGTFIPLYDSKLRAARADVKRVRRASRKKSVCPLDALRVAAEIFAYGRLTGVSEIEAFKEADKVMGGYSTDPCRSEYDLLARPRTWIELRSELVSEKLPKLDAVRKP